MPRHHRIVYRPLPILRLRTSETKPGFEQIPTGSNWSCDDNFAKTVEHRGNDRTQSRNHLSPDSDSIISTALSYAFLYGSPIMSSLSGNTFAQVT